MPKVTVVVPLVVVKVGAGADAGADVTDHASPASDASGLPNWSTNDGVTKCWLVPVTVTGVPVKLAVGIWDTETATDSVTEFLEASVWVTLRTYLPAAENVIVVVEPLVLNCGAATPLGTLAATQAIVVDSGSGFRNWSRNWPTASWIEVQEGVVLLTGVIAKAVGWPTTEMLAVPATCAVLALAAEAVTT